MFLDRKVEVVSEKNVGMNLSSFHPLCILFAKISQLVVANERLVFSFVISRDSHL